MKASCRVLIAAATVALSIASAAAEPLKIDAVMAPKEHIKLDFADGSKQFMLMVRREGRSAGEGLLKDLDVVEYGVHDITPGVGGDPRGYLVFTDAAGNIAYIKWSVRAVFVPGPDGSPMLLDNGVWEVTSGTGKFAGLKGAGTLHIKPVTKTDRRFILAGEVFAAQ